jgi:pimeloyl-ACP methyl ester carboxylesterase
MSMMQLMAIGDVSLEVCDRGAGEPVLLVQTALTADELRPLADQLLHRRGYRTVLFHRRGYADSDPVHGPGSIRRDADDCRRLLGMLGVPRAHVVGLSYSAAIALQLAADSPWLVHTMALLEPPPVHVPSAAEFRTANQRLLATRRARGPAAALEEFLTLVVGPNWRATAERALPGSAHQMQRDASTFLDTDLPALLTWDFGQADVRKITCPVLYVGGTDSGPWFAEVRQLMLSWFPHAEEVILDGADHNLALTHPADIATALTSFVARHPIVARQ